MVNDSGIGSLSFNRIEAVVSFGIRVIEPRKQNLQSAKIAAAVVSNQVIWIIAAYGLVSERSDDAAWHRKTGHQSYSAIGLYRHRIQNLLELRTFHRVFHARKRGDRRLLRQAEVFTAREQNVIFRDVITSSIE